MTELTNLPNINVGLMGHVDSGKTALAKALSVVASTAAFDKNPQSQERGITLDLGFSSAVVEAPDRLRAIFGGDCSQVQLTFVDCPGHASLIRTVIGGAHIIDLVLLVVDVTKGFQTQTAECLLIADIFCPHMVVVLNKCDLLPEAERATKIEKMKQRVWKLLEDSKFAKAPIVTSSASPPDPSFTDVKEVMKAIVDNVVPRDRVIPEGANLVAAVDHCFQVRGQGTVLTGTILAGKVNVGDNIEIIPQKVQKKVKSMQVFRRPVQQAKQGDRVGICVVGLDAELVERALLSTPGTLSLCYAAVASISRIKYYKGDLVSKSKLHVTVAYETTLATTTIFSAAKGAKFDLKDEFKYEADYPPPANAEEQQAQEQLAWFALLEFERPVVFPPDCMAVGAKLDTEPETRQCRLAFSAHVVHPFSDEKYRQTTLPALKVYREKCKRGVVERAQDKYQVIVRSLFKKDTNITNFEGMHADLSTGEKAVIEGAFGQSGKVKLRIPDGLKDETYAQLKEKTGKAQAKTTASENSENQSPAINNSINVNLPFKRYIFDTSKRIVQTKSK